MKLVSVVIPCYKDSSTLARAIDSVIKQTYKNIEIIIINDCSPETAEIELVLNQYHNVNYFKNPANIVKPSSIYIEKYFRKMKT